MLLVAGVTTTAALLYTTRLGYSPAYLMHDEMQFALQSISVAASGRDLSGRRLPIFFTEPAFPAGRDPAVIYLTAAALTGLPISEANVRLPVALLGVLNIVLMFLLARRLFGSDWMALVAAGSIALTPLHFIRSRLLLSPQTSIPVILAWLLCLVAFSERATLRRLTTAAACLALGVYTYLACVVMMPIYWLMTAWIGRKQLGRRAVMTTAAAFAVPLVPMAIWHVTHPERLSQVVGAYELGNSVAATGATLAAALTSVRKALGLYWSFFSPEYLFLLGDPSLINSTRHTGLFPLSFALLIPFGVWHLATRRRDLDLVVLAGLITAPVAAVASGAIEMNRVMFVIPFGALVAVYGVEWLLTAASRAGALVAFAMVAVVPLQFVAFYGDYMGRYRVAAGPAFGGNTRELFMTAIARAGTGNAPPVYVHTAIQHSDRYWRFYALAEGRPDVIDRLHTFDQQLPSPAPAGALLACALADPECAGLLPGAQGWRPIHVVSELDGTRSFALFEAH